MIEQLSTLLADTYALYLKTQNYHWHVRGPHFVSLHELFEEHYTTLANAIDEIAERIRALGGLAPATFSELSQLTTLKEGDAKANWQTMLSDLQHDHQHVIESLRKAVDTAGDNNDEGTVELLGERLSDHEKAVWVLSSLQD